MNTELSDEQLKELEGLYQKATPGTWHDFEQFGVKSEVVADSSGNWLLQSWSKLEERFDNDENNRACVIALHNAFPSLLLAYELAKKVPGLEEEVKRLKKWLHRKCPRIGGCLLTMGDTCGCVSLDGTGFSPESMLACERTTSASLRLEVTRLQGEVEREKGARHYVMEQFHAIGFDQAAPVEQHARSAVRYIGELEQKLSAAQARAEKEKSRADAAEARIRELEEDLKVPDDQFINEREEILYLREKLSMECAKAQALASALVTSGVEAKTEGGVA